MLFGYEWEAGGKKRFIIMLILIVAVSSAIVAYIFVISPSMIGEKKLELSECREGLSEWCLECYSTNDERLDIWENEGTKIGKALAECTNDYFETGWTQEQDCTGTALDYCLPYIEIPEYE